MVQTFVVFADDPTTAKINATERYNMQLSYSAVLAKWFCHKNKKFLLKLSSDGSLSLQHHYTIASHYNFFT